MKLENAVGWGILFLGMVAMTDIPATQQIAAGFAILILISVALLYGPKAADNITKINGGSARTTFKTPGGTVNQ